MRKKQNKNQRGTVLVLAVSIVVILSFIGVALLRLGFYSRLQAIRTTQKISARAAADAGIEHAVISMISWWNALGAAKSKDAITTCPLLNAPVGYTFIDGESNPDTYGSAAFIYNIFPIPSDVNDPYYDDYAVAIVESAGTAGNMTKTVGVKLWFKSDFKAIGVEEGITIKNSGMLYVIPSTEDFTIQTNSILSPPKGGVDLKYGIYVPGEVVIGPGGDTDVAVVVKNDVIIEDGAHVAPDLMKFSTHTPPDLPDGIYYYTDPNDPNSITETPSGPDDIRTIIADGKFPNIDTAEKIIIKGNHGVDSDGQLIPLEVYIIGDVLLKSGAGIEIKQGSAVDLYLGGKMLVMVGADIVYEDAAEQKAIYGKVPDSTWVPDYENFIIEAAKSLTIYGTETCKDIEFNNGADLYALISAPFAGIRMKNSGDFYGAVIASNSFMMDNSSNFYFVAGLFDFPPIEILEMGIKPGSWWEE